MLEGREEEMTREEALVSLLRSLFSTDSLRQFLRWDSRGLELTTALPSGSASLDAVTFAAVEEMVRIGMVDHAFFRRLKDSRPLRLSEIEVVESMWVGQPREGWAAPPATLSTRAYRLPIKMVLSYSHCDEHLVDELRAHLSPLRRQNLVQLWYDRELLPGDPWRGQIDSRIREADVVLLCISSYFVGSDYCYDVEMQQALSQHRAGTTRVIPIFLRPCDWQGAPFAHFQGLPPDARPVTEWKDPHAAWTAIVRGLRRLAVGEGY